MQDNDQDQLYLWNGLLLFLGHRPRSNDWHSHYAASLLISPDTLFRVETEVSEYRCRGILLPPNTRNRIDAAGRLLVLMADPDAARYAALASLTDDKAIVLDGQLESGSLQQSVANRFISPMPADATLEWIDSLIEQLSGQRPASPVSHIDARIQKALFTIQQALPDEVPVDDLAADAELSASRFLHLFKEQLGLPMRQYLLWRRLYEAIRNWDEGMNMTDAAHAAGFYDQAHYTRTMRRMLDVVPSEISRNPQLQIHHAWRDEDLGRNTVNMPE